MEEVTGRSDRIRGIIESSEVMVKGRVLRVPVSIESWARAKKSLFQNNFFYETIMKRI